MDSTTNITPAEAARKARAEASVAASAKLRAERLQHAADVAEAVTPTEVRKAKRVAREAELAAEHARDEAIAESITQESMLAHAAGVIAELEAADREALDAEIAENAERAAELRRRKTAAEQADADARAAQWRDEDRLQLELTARDEQRAAIRTVLAHFGDDLGIKGGGFTTALLETMSRADLGNRARLVAAFPEYGVPFQIAATIGNGTAALVWAMRKLDAGENVTAAEIRAEARSMGDEAR